MKEYTTSALFLDVEENDVKRGEFLSVLKEDCISLESMKCVSPILDLEENIQAISIH